MFDTRHITEHFTVMSRNTVTGLTIKIRSSYLCLPLNLRSTDRKLLKPSASKPSSLKLFPRPTSASNRHKHHKQKTVSDSTIKMLFSNLLVKGVKLAAKGNWLRLTGRCGELRTDSCLPAFWALEPKGA